MTLKMSVDVNIKGTSSKSWTGLAPAVSPFDFGKFQKYTDGTGTDQADVIYLKEISIADGATQTIDLSGNLNDPSGANVVMAELVGICIINEPVDNTTPNTTNLTIGGGSNPVPGPFGATNDTTGPLRPGGLYLMHNPSASGMGSVTAGTGDILTIVNSAGAAAVIQVCIWGRTA